VIRFAPGSVVFRRGGLLLSRSFIAPGLGAVFLGILHLGDNLASLAARVMVVGMRRRLQLGTTFSAFSRHELVLLHVILFQVVRHDDVTEWRRAPTSCASSR